MSVEVGSTRASLLGSKRLAETLCVTKLYSWSVSAENVGCDGCADITDLLADVKQSRSISYLANVVPRQYTLVLVAWISALHPITFQTITFHNASHSYASLHVAMQSQAMHHPLPNIGL